MSYQNQKTVFAINRQTRMNDDYCEKESNIRNNRKMREYQLYPSGANNRNNYINSMNSVGVYQNNGGDGRGHFIDEESSFRMVNLAILLQMMAIEYQNSYLPDNLKVFHLWELDNHR